MVKKFKSTVFSLLFVALAIVPVSEVQGRQELTEEEHSALLEERSVLVEAYLVQVNNEALYEVGVAVVPQNSTESVTVLKLLQCLVKQENSRVISSARVALKKDEEAETSSEKKHYIPRKKVVKKDEGSVESVHFESYSTGVNFEVRLYDMNDDRIRISYSYRHRGLDTPSEGQGTQDSPLETFEFSTQSSVTMPLDKPIIISSSEEVGTSLVFILRAEVVK